MYWGHPGQLDVNLHFTTAEFKIWYGINWVHVLITSLTINPCCTCRLVQMSLFPGFSLCFNSYTPVSHNIKTSCLTQFETPIVTYWVRHKGPLGVSCGFLSPINAWLDWELSSLVAGLMHLALVRFFALWHWHIDSSLSQEDNACCAWPPTMFRWVLCVLSELCILIRQCYLTCLRF